MPKSSNVFDFLQQKAAGSSDYVKFQDGDKRSLRILSQPIVGHELFVDGKPIRWREDEPRPEHAVSDERVKKFVAFIVYEYAGQSDSGAVKVWHFSQSTIIDQMAMLFTEDHWTAYELVVVRVGKGLDTKYNVTGIKSPIEETLLAFCAEAHKYIDLQKLYTGENPFIADLPELEAKREESKPDDLPF